jgi:GT2 family glycosyltransferase
MTKITASMVLYNTPAAQLERLLDCIGRSSVSPITYLIDNSPKALDHPCFHRPNVTYVRAERNNGYGAGHNIALRKVLDDSDFHFILNPDVHFEATELEKMIQFMEADPTIGHLMPKVIYPDGHLQYLCKLLPTPADLFLRRFSFAPLRGMTRRQSERFELRFTNYDKTMDVPFLSGCFMLFRTAALRKIGIFDEQFFLYAEDLDLARRMHAEFRTVFYPGATVVHDHARESYKSARALWVHIFSMAKYFNKWGWFYDPQRAKVNRDTLERLRVS